MRQNNRIVGGKVFPIVERVGTNKEKAEKRSCGHWPYILDQIVRAPPIDRFMVGQEMLFITFCSVMILLFDALPLPLPLPVPLPHAIVRKQFINFAIFRVEFRNFVDMLGRHGSAQMQTMNDVES